MATLTIACVISTAEVFLHWPHRTMPVALAVIFFGSLYTAVRRSLRIAKLLNAR